MRLLLLDSTIRLVSFTHFCCFYLNFVTQSIHLGLYLLASTIINAKQSRLDTLKKKQEQLRAQIQKLESLDKSRERKRDTRRKILLGSYFLEKANEDGSLDSLYQQMEHYLKRNTDGELFQLTPLVEENESQRTEELEEV